MTARTPRPAPLLVLQALRAIAAAFVAFYHVIDKAEKLYATQAAYPLLFPTLGRLGVDIFFVISGFIMVYTTQHRPPQWREAKRFIARRLARIVPLYWLFTSLVVALLLVAPTIFRELQWDWRQIIASYLFVPVTNSMGTTSPLVGVGWTLNYEMYFYAVFALILMLRARIAVLAAFFALSVGLGYLLHPTTPMLQLMTNPLLLEFVVGALAAYSILHGKRVPFAILPVGIAAVIAAAWYASDADLLPFYYGSAIALVIAALVTREREGKLVTPRLLVALGDSSYALYLSHVFTLAIAARLCTGPLRDALGFDGFCALTLLLMLAAGHAVYRFIERPMFQHFRHI